MGKILNLLKTILEQFSTNKNGEWISPQPAGDYIQLYKQLEGFRFDQIAASLQSHTEEVLVNWMEYWVKKTGIHSVVFSGGLSLNVKVNFLLYKQEWIHRFHVPPAGSDDSLPLGACYLFSHKEGSWKDLSPLPHCNLGPHCEESESKFIIEVAREAGFHISQTNPKKVAELLVTGKIIGRCQGRMEFGPRALGNRSILARADHIQYREKLNNQIKHRDWWMPFAPLLREEFSHSLLDIPKGVDGSFMTLCFDTTPEGIQELIGAIHPKDKTARAQILKKETNPELEEILSQYEHLSGKKGLINTSFNLHGSPIVKGPSEAYQTFLKVNWMGFYYLTI